MTRVSASLMLAAVCGSCLAGQTNSEWTDRERGLKRRARRNKPLTGFVAYDTEDPEVLAMPELALEFLYVTPEDVCAAVANGQAAATSIACSWDFSAVKNRLENIASRGHQAVIRLASVKQGSGWELNIPTEFLAENGGLIDTTSRSVWGSPVKYGRWDTVKAELGGKNSFEEFYRAYITQVATELDNDVRVAYVQGFAGHWSEGHVYREDLSLHHDDIGIIFPSPSQYLRLLQLAESVFVTTHYQAGISVADQFYWYDSSTRSADSQSLQTAVSSLSYGTFEDSFLDVNPATVRWNAELLSANSEHRWTQSPRGGEVSFGNYNGKSSQVEAAKPTKSRLFKSNIKSRHMTFSLGSKNIILRVGKLVSASFGYNFRVLSRRFSKRTQTATITLLNNGAAPIYYDTFMEIGTYRFSNNLKSILPGQRQVFQAKLTMTEFRKPIVLVCNKSLTGQIPYD